MPTTHDVADILADIATDMDAVASRLRRTRSILSRPLTDPIDGRIGLRLTPDEAVALKRLLDDHTYTYVGADQRRRLVSVQHRLTGALADLAVEVTS